LKPLKPPTSDELVSFFGPYYTMAIFIYGKQYWVWHTMRAMVFHDEMNNAAVREMFAFNFQMQ